MQVNPVCYIHCLFDNSEDSGICLLGRRAVFLVVLAALKSRDGLCLVSFH